MADRWAFLHFWSAVRIIRTAHSINNGETMMKNTSSAKRLAVAAALGATAISLPLMAWADLSAGDTIGTSEAEIRATLQSLGYVVEEIEFESDEIEAEVTLDGVEYEIEIDPATGLIAEIELEDD